MARALQLLRTGRPVTPFGGQRGTTNVRLHGLSYEGRGTAGMAHIQQLHPDSGSSGRNLPGPELSGMDVARVPTRRIGRILWIVIGLVGVAGVTLLLGSLEPAGTRVNRDLLAIGQVRQGPMARQIYGWGAFVPDRVQIVLSEQSGKITAVYATTGDRVQSGDRLIEMSNAEIALAVDKAEQKFASARAGMIALSREQSARRLSLEASIADTRTTYLNAEDELEGLVSQAGGKSTEFQVLRAKEKLKAIGQRIASDEERLELIRVSTEEQVAAQRDELRWLEAILESQRTRLRSLMLRAAGDGLVEEMLVQRGSLVGGGVALARIALSDRLKAELQVYVSGGSEIEPGQAVSLESESAIVSGHVDEVLLAAGEKLLHVSVTLDENPRIPEGGSHKLHAMIQLETLDNVVSVELPSYAASNEWSSVFRLLPDGKSAERIKVRFGRGSVDRIEVLSGLGVGDRIIVSDVSEFDDLDLIEID